MLTVKDFAEKVLNQIHQLYNKMSLVHGQTVPVEIADTSVLVRYESMMALELLQNMLNNTLDNGELSSQKATEESLVDFINLLENRWQLTANSDCIPNHSLDTYATKAYVILANELSACLTEIDNGNGPETLHAYHYLFPTADAAGFAHRQYTDEYMTLLLGDDDAAIQQFKGQKYSRVDITQLPLSHFIWADEFRNNVQTEARKTPIVVLASIDLLLENLRKGEREVFPGHTCVDIIDSKSRSPILLQSEASRILSHSPEALNYLSAVRELLTGRSESLLAKIREKREALVSKLSEPDFIATPKYSNSDAVLLQDGWLRWATRNIVVSNLNERGQAVNQLATKDGSIDIWILADFMSAKLYREHWNDFIQIIAKTDNLLDNCTIPMKAGELDLSIFDDGTTNFNNFVRYCFGEGVAANSFSTYCSDKAADTDYCRALLFILTELYIRHRSGSPAGKYTSAIGSITDGVVDLCYSRTDKTQAGKAFQSFLIQRNYQLDQFKLFCRKNGKLKSFDVLNSGRTQELLNVAVSHGPGMASKMSSLKDVVEQLFVNQRENGTDWRASLERVKDPTLLALVAPNSSSINEDQAFKDQVRNYKNYVEGNDEHNRAVLFILSECYLRIRGALDETTSSKVVGTLSGWLPSYARPYTRRQKVEVITAFQDFMMDPGIKRPNQVVEYLASVNPEYPSIMADGQFAKVNGSKTAVLLLQANNICDSNYFVSERKNQQSYSEQSRAFSPN